VQLKSEKDIHKAPRGEIHGGGVICVCVYISICIYIYIYMYKEIDRDMR